MEGGGGALHLFGCLCFSLLATMNYIRKWEISMLNKSINKIVAELLSNHPPSLKDHLSPPDWILLPLAESSKDHHKYDSSVLLEASLEL